MLSAKSPKLVSSFILFCLILLAVLISNPVLRNPRSYFEQAANQWKVFFTSWNAKDPSYESRLDLEMQSLVFQARSVKDFYYIPLSDHVREPEIVSTALPKRYVNDKNLQYAPGAPVIFMYGPQPQPPSLESQTRQLYWMRWARMAIALLCWIGATAFFSHLSISIRILLGAFITGWGLWLTSLVLGLSLQQIYNVWVPLCLFGALIVCARGANKITRKSIQKFLKTQWTLILSLILFPSLWMPFFMSPLSGPDARSMWFHRYKFEYFFGFIPQEIVRFMYEGSQRDYPWFLGGAVGIASWMDGIHIHGWNENAVYGTLVWLLVALLSVLWSQLSNVKHLWKLFILPLGFLPFEGFICNGYMDVFWITSFGLFLAGYFSKSMQQRKLWLLAALAASFKNEGVACLMMFLLYLFVSRKGRQETIGITLREVLTWATAFSIPVFQKIYLSTWGIYDQYRLSSRIMTYPLYDAIKRWESLHRYLIRDIFIRRPSYFLPVFLMVLGAYLYRRGNQGWRTFGFTYMLCIPISLIYVYTPHDQDWQLITSGSRVFMLYPIWCTIVLLNMMKSRSQS